jgi:hypothetical protein
MSPLFVGVAPPLFVLGPLRLRKLPVFREPQLSEIWKKTWIHNANLRFHHSFPRIFEYCNVGFSTHSIVRKKKDHSGMSPNPWDPLVNPKLTAIYGCSSFPFMALSGFGLEDNPTDPKW